MYKINLPIYNEQKCILFSLGRNAMYAACMTFGLKAGDEILTPAFDCDGSLQPFKVLGYKLKFIRSNPYTFDIDIEDIKRNIAPETKLIHIINHFGIPQPWDKLLLLRKEIDIPILEDNAYSLFSKYGGQLLGTFGDISIFSLRKHLPLADGGMFRINNQKYTFKLPFQKPGLFYFTEMYSILRVMGRKLSFYKSPINNPMPPLYSEKEKGYPNCRLRDVIEKRFSCNYLRPISILAELQLSRFSEDDYADIVNKKKEYYTIASQRLENIKNITVLHPELGEEVVPFCLSILIEHNRDIFLKKLHKKYDVMAWPTFSDLVLSQLHNFPEVELLGRKVLQINLLSDRVRSSGFMRYLEKLLKDIEVLAKQYL